jgi:nucleotide-binding universal stress UspA family protein
VAVDPPSPAPPTTVIETLALATGWPLVLVNASPQGTTAEQLDGVGRRLDDSARTFTERGIDARSITLVGPPVEVILAEAEAVRAAVIVVVARRHDLNGRPMLDSVTSALLKVADRPVLVLPSGASPVRPGFVAAVERLLDLIDRTDTERGDAVSRHTEPADELDQRSELRQAALDRLPAESEPDRSRLDRRLLDALHRFETDHPTLTAAVNDVAHHLSGLGS